MRILFVNRTFPGSYGPLASCLAGRHEVLFCVSKLGRGGIPGVRNIMIAMPAGKSNALEDIASQAQSVQQRLGMLAAAGLEPDVILASAWLGSLALRQVWPGALLLACTDTEPFPLNLKGDLLRTFVQGRLFMDSDVILSTAFRLPETRSLEEVYGHVERLPRPVDTKFFAPGRGKTGRTLLVLCPGDDIGALDGTVAHLQAHPGARASLLAERLQTRNRLKQALAELDGAVADRLHVCASLTQESYRDLLAAADILVGPGSMRGRQGLILEAMSCGVVPLLGPGDMAGPVEEGATAAVCTGQDLAGTLERLCGSSELARMQALARERVVAEHDVRRVMARHLATIEQICAGRGLR